MTYPQSADPSGPHNQPPTYSPRVRLAVLAGSLTPARVDAILAEIARRPDVNPVTLLTNAECHHILFIQQSLGPNASVDDVFAAVRAIGRG